MRKPKTGILTLLALSLVALFSVGCGNSESFVFTGPVTNPPAPGTTGNLLFKFEQPVTQTAGLLPADATEVFFSLHSGSPPSNANFVQPRGPVSVASILANDGFYEMEDVPGNVNTVVVVARSADGLPLFAWVASTQVVAGETTPVNLGQGSEVDFTVTPNPNPIRLQKDGASQQLSLTLTFDLETGPAPITLPSYDTPEVTITPVADTNNPAGFVRVANFTTTGLFTADTHPEELGGNYMNGDVTVTYDLFGKEASTNVGVEIFCFEVTEFQVYGTLAPGSGPQDIAIDAFFTGPDGVEIELEDDNATDMSRMTFVSSPAGVTVEHDGTNGVIEAASTATPGEYTITITYTDPDYPDFPVTDTAVVTVVPGSS